MSNQRYIRNRGFTDKLYFKNLIFAWAYTILCLIFTLLGKKIEIEDYSFVHVVCPLVWAELTVHTGFIIWKSKIENLSKFAGDSIKDNASMNVNMDI